MSFKKTLNEIAKKLTEASKEQKDRQQENDMLNQNLINFVDQTSNSIKNTNKILSYINDKQQNLTAKIVVLENQFNYIQQNIEEILFMFETLVPVELDEIEAVEYMNESSILTEEQERNLTDTFKLEDPDWIKHYGAVNLDKEELN